MCKLRVCVCSGFVNIKQMSTLFSWFASLKHDTNKKWNALTGEEEN